MIDEVGAIITLVLAGAAGGFISSWLSFNASGEKFEGRKHGNAIVTGIIGGMAIGVATALAGVKDMAAGQFALIAFLTFIGTAGGDRIRSNFSKMIANRGIELDKELGLKPKVQEVPAVTTTTTVTKEVPKAPDQTKA